MNENLCLCCGTEIAEGRQICYQCEIESHKKNTDNEISCPYCDSHSFIELSDEFHIIGKDIVKITSCVCSECNGHFVS